MTAKMGCALSIGIVGTYNKPGDDGMGASTSPKALQRLGEQLTADRRAPKSPGPVASL